MSRRRRCFVGIFAGVLMLGGLGIWWQNKNAAPPALVEIPSTAARAKPKSAPPGAGAAGDRVAAALPEFGTEAFNLMAKERGAAWMASRNRDAVSLLAMYDLTGDETILREAAERFPGNPQVCLAMLGVVFDMKQNEAEQKKWTDLLIAADPENPLGYYYQARLAQAAGNRAGVISALEEALGKTGRLNHYLRERMVGAKEGLLASGVDVKDTYFLSLAGPMTRGSAGLMGSNKLIKFFKDEFASMKASGRSDEIQNLAALGLQASEQLRQTKTSTMITELTALSWRAFFLKEMDSGTEIVNTGRSVAEEQEAVAVEKIQMGELMKTTNAAHEYLHTAPLEVRGQYADRMMMDGEIAAMRYAMEEMKKANPQPE